MPIPRPRCAGDIHCESTGIVGRDNSRRECDVGAATGCGNRASTVGARDSSAGTRLNTTSAVTSTNGGAGNVATASLAVVATLVPDLTITTTHTGHFRQGQTGAAYTITITNAGNGPSSGTRTVMDTLPAGLTATGISGSGWTCTLGSLSCTRADVLAAGGSDAALTLIVNVATTTASSVTDVANVSGGGEANTTNDTASDVTIVDGPSGPADFSIAVAAANATRQQGIEGRLHLDADAAQQYSFCYTHHLGGVGRSAEWHCVPVSACFRIARSESGYFYSIDFHFHRGHRYRDQ